MQNFSNLARLRNISYLASLAGCLFMPAKFSGDGSLLAGFAWVSGISVG